jgi:hypothetical protein
VAKQENTIRSILETSNKVIPLGSMLYKAAKDVVTMSPNGVPPDVDSLSPGERNSWIIMRYSHSLATRGNEFDAEQEKEYYKSGLFDVFLPEFAKSFLQKFPTHEIAVKQFSRPIALFDFHSADTRVLMEQVLNLTVEEANDLIKAKPLVTDFKNKLLTQGVAKPAEPPNPPEPKQRGGKIDLWLDWYHAMNDNGYKCTLEDVAKKSGYSVGYIKQKHMVYQAKPNQNT